MKNLLLLLFFLLISNTSYSLDSVKLDSLMDIISNNDKAMGSLSIYENGTEVYTNSLGYENVENSLKATPKTEYRIGSISKTFTATIIMKLVERNLITLDTKLSKYYPQIENAALITIRHLLKHRSGIFNFTNDEKYLDYMEDPISKKDLVAKIASFPSSFEPNSKADYSNSNYVLLSFIAEDILNKKFPQILKEEITEVCKLKNTYYGGKIGKKSNEAQSYTYNGEWTLATETDMSVPIGAGAIVSTASDLNKFLYCLFNGKLVSEKTLATMIEIEEGFGIGLFKVPYNNKVAYGHTGGIDGFQSNAFYFIDEKISITYLSNGVALPVNNLLVGVLKIYFGDEYDLPSFAPAITVAPSDLAKYEGTYSTPSVPMKIKIFVEDGALYGQATGQSSFPLEPYEKHKFRFEPAMLTIEFRLDKSEMVISQGGSETVMKKE